MGDITTHLSNELLDHVLNQATHTPDTNLYLCLCTADPTDAATGASMNEVANSGSYQRTAIAFSAASSRLVDQSGDVDFPTATGPWGDVTHWTICNNQTYGSGDVLAHGAFSETKSIVSGNSPTVAAGSNDVNVSFSAGFISDYLANELLDHAFNNSAYTAPTTTYVGLTTATIDDTDDGDTITEVSAGGYARELVDENGGSSPTWSLAAAELVSNLANVDIGPATASWGTVVAAFVADALTSGEVLFYDNGVSDQAVGNGDTFRFPTGDLDVTMD